MCIVIYVTYLAQDALVELYLKTGNRCRKTSSAAHKYVRPPEPSVELVEILFHMEYKSEGRYSASFLNKGFSEN